MARSCNTGVSCFVDAQGRIQKGDKLRDPETGSVFVRGVLSKEVNLVKQPEMTFYARFGDAFAVAMLLICAGAAFRSRRPRGVK
jgi:apolipoprotein N-acyltransferase